MHFYSSIAPFYDIIFPYQPLQKDFVLRFHSGGPGSTLLDVGCGSGSLALALCEHFEQVNGIDPDEEMLGMAKKKAKDRGDTRYAIREMYKEGGMLDVAKLFEKERFDVVLCLGNTLVHLASDDEVRDFLQQSSQVLKPGGSLIIQIINYDRVIDQKLGGLPTIENEQCRFERIYQYPLNPGHLRFITRLTIKVTGQVIENDVPLLALRPGQLRGMLREAGFEVIEEVGSFKGEAFTADAQPYIVEGKK